jgi:hypothetical protein
MMKQIWTIGRRDCGACIELTEYRDGVVIASAESDHITPNQMKKALRKRISTSRLGTRR